MALKRFVADWAYEHRNELPNMRDKSLLGTPFSHHPEPTGKKVAIIGAGPAGLTAALDLVRPRAQSRQSLTVCQWQAG